ncbi:MAG: hypothetical protein ACKOA1_06695, partial [Bacteroidota bacterium]
LALQESNVHYFTSGDPILDNDTVLVFRRYYREKYATEPLESAYVGYDAIRMILKCRSKAGRDFLMDPDMRSYRGIFSEYKFERPVESECYENKRIVVWSFENIIPERVVEKEED